MTPGRLELSRALTIWLTAGAALLAMAATLLPVTAGQCERQADFYRARREIRPDDPWVAEQLVRQLLKTASGYLLKQALAWNRSHRCGLPRAVFDPVRGSDVVLDAG